MRIYSTSALRAPCIGRIEREFRPGKIVYQRQKKRKTGNCIARYFSQSVIIKVAKIAEAITKSTSVAQLEDDARK